MSGRLPVLKPRDLIRLLKENGFVVIRQKGSHCSLRHMERGKQVTVPIHPKDLGRGLTAKILEQAGIEY